MRHFDITIIGNRIAAASALISLGQRFAHSPPLTVALIAPKPSTKTRPLIGESLPPTVKPLLQKMHLWEDFCAQQYPAPEVRFTCWGSDQLHPSFAEHSPNGFGWCVDRHQFEQRLWQRAQHTPFDRLETRFKHSEKTPHGWRLKLSSGEPISTRFVLDCSGRTARFAKTHSTRQKGPRILAACDFLNPLNEPVERTSGVMIEAVKDGWWYSALLPNGQLAVAYFTDHQHMPKALCQHEERWQHSLDHSQYTQLRIQTGAFSSYNQPHLYDASMSCLTQTTGDHWLACGDAAITLDPLSSHGMSTALWSGHKGANACIEALQGKHQGLQAYNQSCQQNWQLYCQQRQTIYRQQNRFQQASFWQNCV